MTAELNLLAVLVARGHAVERQPIHVDGAVRRAVRLERDAPLEQRQVQPRLVDKLDDECTENSLALPTIRYVACTYSESSPLSSCTK